MVATMKRAPDTEQLPQLYGRWANLEAQRTDLQEDLKYLFAEAKAFGLNTKAVRIAFADQYRRDNEEPGKRAARQLTASEVDLYLAALARVREDGEDMDPETGEFSTAPNTSNTGTLGSETADLSTTPIALGRPHAQTEEAAPLGEQSAAPITVAGVTAPEGLASPASVADERVADTKDAIISAPVYRFNAEAKPIRPHCQNPGPSCAGEGRNHCHRCRQIAAGGEAA